MDKHDRYIDNVLISLRRKYSRDEYINSLVKKIENQTHNILELNTKLEMLKKENNSIRKRNELLEQGVENTKAYKDLQRVLSANLRTFNIKNKIIEDLKLKISDLENKNAQ
ncbi:hypothetical protein [Croceivirga sp. JEA036]|uniref:hypothetical protein n=1 Tax=Croceivirga sp. JEA036 TaxID=2721162 RepID=UPI00143B9986|nr:hypothetical protein [Croceivirga sp. JEA036]NJB36374.1 hypothetical protein [Croceivirga sp. JEA036]